MDLLRIESPAFVKTLSLNELEDLAQEIRDFMIASITKTEGQLASNLSSVELTIGLHKVFNAATDKILFDAIHQSYTHKIITGRANNFSSLRQMNGMSGFQLRDESVFDPFDATNLGQALSIGLGYSMKNEADEIIVVLSQDSLATGQVYEALNHLSLLNRKMIIIINDNQDNDELNSVSTSFKNLMIAKPVTQLRDDMSQFFDKGNIITKPLKRGIKNLGTNLSKTVTQTNLFTELGLKYVGPFDGHSIRDVIRVLNFAQSSQSPVVIHFKTKLGKGYKTNYNKHAGLWVDLNEFDLTTGETIIQLPEGYKLNSHLMIDQIQHLLRHKNDLALVNSIKQLSHLLPDEKVFQYSLGNNHLLSFASGLSLSGIKPIVLIDSLEVINYLRPLVFEFSFMKLNLIIVELYTGLRNIEGGLQSSLFNYPLYSLLPNVIIAHGKNIFENNQLLQLACDYDGPFIIRVFEKEEKPSPISEIQFKIGQWELERNGSENPQAIIFTFGALFGYLVEKIQVNELPIWVVNCRFINILDETLLQYLHEFNASFYLITEEYEQGTLQNNLNQYFKDNEFIQKLETIHLPKQFLTTGPSSVLRKSVKIDTNTILNKIINDLKENDNTC